MLADFSDGLKTKGRLKEFNIGSGNKIGRIESTTNKQTGSSEKFSFDPANNILSDGLKDKGRLKGTNIGSGNRLESFNGTEYTYDALGNLIYRQLPNGENQYFVYDTENQLIKAEIKKPAGNTEIWEYAYDPFGRRLSKERKDKLAWVSTEPKRTHFVWDGSRLLQEYTYKGDYTYIYTDQDSYEPLAQVFLNGKDEKQYLAYFHNDQIGIPREMTDQFGNLLWYGEYTAWGRLKKDERIYKEVHQPFRLQNQYHDAETGLHYNLMRYYEPDMGRFVNQDPIRLWGSSNLYFYAPNIQNWYDLWGFTAAALRRSMLTDNRSISSWQTPHHIVQENSGKSPYSGYSRDLLARNNISVNDSANGAALAGTHPSQVNHPNHPGRATARANGIYHAGQHLHGPDADRTIYRALRAAEKRGLDVEKILRNIGARMEAGTWEATLGACKGKKGKK